MEVLLSWLARTDFFSSIFSIFVETLFICFLPSIFKLNNTFSLPLSSMRISVSKASLVFTQLNPPINVFSKTLTCSASAGRAKYTFTYISMDTSTERTCRITFMRIIFKKLFKVLRTLLKNFTKNDSVLKIGYFIELTKIF